MPIKTYATKDEIPAELREAALTLADGKFAVEEVVDTTKLTTALDKERQRAKDEKAAREAAEKERDELKQKKEAAEKGISEVELQKIKDAEAAARKPIEEENARLKAENDKLKRTDKVRSVALAKGIMQDRIDDAMSLLDARTTLTDQGNVAVKDKAGTVTTESLETFLEKTFKTEKPWLYAGPGGSGSGAGGNESGGGSGYDPAAAGKKAGERQKQAQADASLALK
jgi:hypothetical protein